MSDKKRDGLEPDFMKRFCWPGNDSSKWCRYVRIHKGRYICAKGTAAGMKHDARLKRWSEQGLLPQEEVLFDSGASCGQAEDKRPKWKFHLGDNCQGRADEFAHLFDEDAS
jgi:hypothetical protein